MPVLKVGPQLVFEHLLNDPTTPGLVCHVPFPKADNPMINVIGFREGKFVRQDSVRAQAAGVYVAITKAMKWINKIRPIKRWAATDVLQIVPRSGRQFNAFYDRFALRFFYDVHPVTRKTVFTADSMEAVLHEFGHAVLDAFRPDLWNQPVFEFFAFHEAFGDIISMLSSLQYPEVIEHALKESPDLSGSNVISRMAEEMGEAIYLIEPNKGRPSNCLRDAVKVFNYVDPNSLPSNGNFGTLCRESHNFSRVLSGAWYAIFVEIFKRYGSAEKARDVMAHLSINAIVKMERNNRIYNSFAKAMIDGESADIVRFVFLSRGILEPLILY